MKDEKFNWDKFRKYKIIALKGALLKCIHKKFNISRIKIRDPQTNESITFDLIKKKELYSETGVMIMAIWCDKVLSLPRFQSFDVATDIEKLSYIWDEGWTDELMECILTNVSIAKYPLWIPLYRILNKNKLREIFKNNNLLYVNYQFNLKIIKTIDSLLFKSSDTFGKTSVFFLFRFSFIAFCMLKSIKCLYSHIVDTSHILYQYTISI